MAGAIEDLLLSELLNRESYEQCLRKFISRHEVTALTSDTLITLIKAWESGNKTKDESMEKLYNDLLQYCLYPQLAAIIMSHEYEGFNNFEDFRFDCTQNNDSNEVQKTKSNHLVNLTKCANVGSDHVSKLLPSDELKLADVNELIMAPKIIECVTHILKTSSFCCSKYSYSLENNIVTLPASEFDKSQNIYSMIGDLISRLANGLHNCGLDNFTGCYPHRVKILSLIFANLMTDDTWLCLDRLGLTEAMKKVIEVTLTLIKSSHDADITALLLNLIIRPYVEKCQTEGSCIIERLWSIVISSFIIKNRCIEGEKNCTGYLILFFIAEFVFDKGMLSKIIGNDTFYMIIQYGLMHSDSLSRKRSQFILKRVIDHCSSASESISCTYLSCKACDKITFQSTWNEFFLLCETLEEKQSHVVWPVLEKFDKLFELMYRDKMHVSWILVIFKRIFDHDNKSIKYWGVVKFLNMKLSEDLLINGIVAFINTYLLLVLSDYSLYGQESGQSHDVKISSVGEQFGTFLVNVVTCLDSPHVEYFMCSLLERIFDGRSWGGIPLFYVVRGLSVIPSTGKWNCETVKKALIRFKACLSTQEIVIRSASQCDFLKAVLKHLDKDTSVIELCSIVRHFRRRECWCRGTVMWKILVESIDGFEEKYDSMLGFSSCSRALNTSLSTSPSQREFVIHPQDVALGICFLLERAESVSCEKERKNSVNTFLQPVVNFLSGCHLRPYLDQQKYKWVLELLAYVVEILSDIAKGSSYSQLAVGECLLSLQESIGSIIQLFPVHITNFLQPHDHELLSLYLHFFDKCHDVQRFMVILKSHSSENLSLCMNLLSDGNQVKFSFGIIMLEYLLSHLVNGLANSPDMGIIQLTIEKVLNNISEITERRHIEGCSSSESTKELLVKVIKSCWGCLEHLVKEISSWTDEALLPLKATIESKCLPILLDGISIAGRLNVISVYNICVDLAPVIIKEGLWHDITKLMWQSSSEFKKCCDLYRSLMKCLSEVLYHPLALLQEKCCSLMQEISENLLVAAEGVQGIAYLMARSVVQSFTSVFYSDSFNNDKCDVVIDLLVSLVRFGAVFRKQQKIIRDTTNYIQCCGELYSSNELLQCVETDQHARAVVLRFLLMLDKNRSQEKALAGRLFLRLKAQYALWTGDRREFANSQKHRYKTRLLQTIMLLLPLLSKEECQVALVWLCQGMIKEQQQPSVRYMQEWSISLIIILHPEFYSTFFELFRQGTKERVGCVGSFLAALTHIACTSDDASVLCRSIEHTLPWCMGQHFNTRLYAQVSLRKIWHHCESSNITEVLSKYMTVQHCLQFVAEQGNAARNTSNMLNDFYFKVFHPIRHYTLETIFYDLPCLSLLSNDEWLTLDTLMAVEDTTLLPICSDLPPYNADKVLSESVPAPWVVKAVGDNCPTEEQDDVETSRNVVQKKMTPWKSMMPEISCSLDLPHMELHNQKRGGLIMVASLIDKAPNLGGLCRTCEVFSVREYVVPSLAIQDDQNFNSLSLTAQQWVPMKEVRPENLPGYLRALQSEGYMLVAAEQTANSKLLSDFDFPERTAVILGNEREGIPCDILQLLDVCVEIPQTGIIRSLNVHVSGALFIWEYTRQHRGKVLVT